MEVAHHDVLGLIIFFLKKIIILNFPHKWQKLSDVFFKYQFRVCDDDEPLVEGIPSVESDILASEHLILLPKNDNKLFATYFFEKNIY